VHALSISYILINLAKYEQDVQQYPLRLGPSEIRLFWHTPFNILENLLPNFFVLPQGVPWGLKVSAI
jgi:hypothetical protein